VIQRAIELNGEEVAMDLAAFRYGRRRRSGRDQCMIKPKPEALTTRSRYRNVRRDSRPSHRILTPIRTPPMHGVIAAGSEVGQSSAKAPGRCGLARSVARYRWLMAYKDEYEVARSMRCRFGPRESTFDGESCAMNFISAACWRATVTGEPRKCHSARDVKVFAALAKFKFLRGRPSMLSATRPSGKLNSSSLTMKSFKPNTCPPITISLRWRWR
jgi:hypothetical protein